MYSRFFQHTDAGMLEVELDMFLKDLEEVTGKIISIQLLERDDAILVLVIYTCWKKL